MDLATSDYDKASEDINNYTNNNPYNQGNAVLQKMLQDRQEQLRESSKKWQEEMDKRNEESKQRLAEQMEASNAKRQADADALNKQLAENAALAKQAQAHIYRMQVFNEQGMHNELDNEAQSAKNTLNAAVAKFTNTKNSYPQNRFVSPTQRTPQPMQIGRLGTLPSTGGSSSQPTSYSDEINAMFDRRYSPQKVIFSSYKPEYNPLEGLPPIELVGPENSDQNYNGETSSTTQPAERTSFLDDLPPIPQSNNQPVLQGQVTRSFLDDLLGMPPAYGDTLTKNTSKSGNNYKLESFLPKQVNLLSKTIKDISLAAKIQKNIVENTNSPALSHRYYRIALSNLNSINSLDNDNIKIKVNDIKNLPLKNFIEQKYNIASNTDVVVPKYGADIRKAIESSPELKKVIKSNYLSIKNNTYLNKSIGLNFRDNISPDLALTIGKSVLYNPKIDKKGNFSAISVDYYDFAKMTYKPFVSYVNNNAYEQQEKKSLKNYVIIVPIKIDANTLRDYINEK